MEFKDPVEDDASLTTEVTEFKGTWYVGVSTHYTDWGGLFCDATIFFTKSDARALAEELQKLSDELEE